jgi:plastocyanin
LCWLWCLAAIAAHAAEAVITVTDPAGAALPWAVVSLSPAAGQGPGSWLPTPAVMKQQGTQFVPFVLSVRAGTEVKFPNLDEVRHHVYSFSRAKSFELRLYGQDETKTVVFDEAGAIALGCNIHDNMLSFIYVTTDPVHDVTDSSGAARFAGLPAGNWQVRVWHPDLAGDGPSARLVTLMDRAAVDLALPIELRSVRRRQLPPGTGRYR